MASNVSFELYSLKEELWQLDSVFHSKQDATHEAHRLIIAGHFDGIRVVQETYDEKANKAIAVTILERKKGEEPKKPVQRNARPEKKDLSVTKKKPTPKASPKKTGMTHHLGVMVLVVCGILLAIVAAGFFIV